MLFVFVLTWSFGLFAFFVWWVLVTLGDFGVWLCFDLVVLFIVSFCVGLVLMNLD